MPALMCMLTNMHVVQWKDIFGVLTGGMSTSMGAKIWKMLVALPGVKCVLRWFFGVLPRAMLTLAEPCRCSKWPS